MAGLLQGINLDLPKVAIIAVELEALGQKSKNGVNLLREEFDKLPADSPKIKEYNALLGENLEDVEENIAPKIANLSTVAQELFDDMKKLEGSDEIIAQARATANKKTDKSQKTRLPR